MVTSNGVGAGHLIRASAIARKLKDHARPIIFSMAYSVIEVCTSLGIECEYVPGRDKGLMGRQRWDRYLRDRLVALIDETNAKIVTFDGVVPYPGILGAKFRRPEVTFVWIRRGMWQRKPQGMAISIQSKLMDYVVEPGDVAREYDVGPTRYRNEAVLTSPVSLYNKGISKSKKLARATLGLDPFKTCVLVQLGVGDRDLDERVSVVLKGLSSWPNLEIVMAKKTIGMSGESLVPAGVDVKIIRYFPLADVIHAFDAIVCAAGYNSVHEVIPAQVPTLLIANNRGTDDQFARAKWCADHNLTLFASNESLEEIEAKARKLMEPEVRKMLSRMCRRMGRLEGDREIASMILMLANDKVSMLIRKRMRYQRFLAQSAIERGLGHAVRKFANATLRLAALAYRTIFPHEQETNLDLQVTFSRSLDLSFCSPKIKGNSRFEHILVNSSQEYLDARKLIALRAYRLEPSELIYQDSSGTFESIAFNSVTISK